MTNGVPRRTPGRRRTGRAEDTPRTHASVRCRPPPDAQRGSLVRGDCERRGGRRGWGRGGRGPRVLTVGSRHPELGCGGPHPSRTRHPLPATAGVRPLSWREELPCHPQLPGADSGRPPLARSERDLEAASSLSGPQSLKLQAVSGLERMAAGSPGGAGVRLGGKMRRGAVPEPHPHPHLQRRRRCAPPFGCRLRSSTGDLQATKDAVHS